MAKKAMTPQQAARERARLRAQAKTRMDLGRPRARIQEQGVATPAQIAARIGATYAAQAAKSTARAASATSGAPVRWSRGAGVAKAPAKTSEAAAKAPSGRSWSSKSGSKTTAATGSKASTKTTGSKEKVVKKPTRSDLKSPVPYKKRVAAGGAAAVATGLAFGVAQRRAAAERERKGKTRAKK